MGFFTRAAILCDHFHYNMDQIARMTQGQCNAILFHKRKEHGEIDTVPHTAQIEAKSEALVEDSDMISSRHLEYNRAICALSASKFAGHLREEQFYLLVDNLKAKYPDVMDEIATGPKKDIIKEAKFEVNLAGQIEALSKAVELGVLSQKAMDEAIAKKISAI